RRGDIIWFADPAERRLSLILLPEVALNESLGVGPLGFNHARVNRIHPDLLGTQFLREGPGYRVHGAFGRAVDRRIRYGGGGDRRTHVDDAPAAWAEVPHRLL